MNDAIHLVCPHCQAVNRVPPNRLNQQPNCGQCHQPLFTGHPLELTEASFSKHLTQSQIPLLVDFWAAWCGPCKMMAPAFAQAAGMLEPTIRLGKVDTDRHRYLSEDFGIRSIPTLILFKNGREIAREAGAMSLQDILRWTRSHLA
ncbi:thioredoxin TrxC [Methylomonas sp. UP202]|uniref:thioredoxin TrxC n=1 Tax=Methylomonas sp. UP202 TaxID=3040943 RepID=UPI0024787396|nr:thioredoxin TrxC [Methylomonas sp. UP202]WGS85750.1 thioredoxin TrxC [Methylomonas sp. UP202]